MRFWQVASNSFPSSSVSPAVAGPSTSRSRQASSSVATARSSVPSTSNCKRNFIFPLLIPCQAHRAKAGVELAPVKVHPPTPGGDILQSRPKLTNILKRLCKRGINEISEQFDSLCGVADALAAVHIAEATAGLFRRRAPFTTHTDRPDTGTGHNHDPFQAKLAAPVTILIAEPFTRDQAKVQKRRICCTARITPAIATSSSELNCHMNAKRVPRAFVPCHASLDQPMKLVDCRLGPYEQSAPRRRTDVEQHHMKLIALIGNNHIGHRL